MDFFGDNKPSDDLGKESLRGGMVTILARGFNVIVRVGSIVVLARLLSPDDYGLVAMVYAITGLAPAFADLGTRDAMVQKPSITPNEVSALFWLSLAIGCAMALLVAGCSPWIAKFYDEPRVIKIALVSSLSFIISSLTFQHHSLLRRAMMFKRLAWIEIAANVLSAGIVITVAVLGGGYWALVLKPMLESFLVLIGVWSSSRWVPGIPKITPGVKEMVKFGLNLTGFTTLDYVAGAADRVGLGRAVGGASLGYYQQGLAIYNHLLLLIGAPLHNVAVSSLSKLRTDPERLRRSWAKALRALAFFAMPAFGVLAVTGQEVVVVLLGEKWQQAGFLLMCMAIRGIPHIVERTLGWLHVSAGRADRWMRWGAISAVVHIAALACGLPFGALGVVVAYAATTYVILVPAIAYAGQPLGIGAGLVMRVIGRPFVGALIEVGIGLVVRRSLPDSHRMLTIVALGLVYTITYLVIVVGLFRMREPLQLARRACGEFAPPWLSRWMRPMSGRGKR